MSIRLSKTKIESYVGNVLPLRLISEENIENISKKGPLSSKESHIMSEANEK